MREEMKKMTEGIPDALLSCEIIQDLLPLYVDEVCSKDTRKAVDMHLAVCEACQKSEEQLRRIDFSAQSIEKKELDGLKKIRKKMNRQKMLSAVLLGVILLLGLQAFWGNVYVPMGIHLMMLVICIFGWQQMGKRALQKPEGKDVVTIVLSVAAWLGSVVVLCLAFSQVLAGEPVLGVALEHAGPLLARIWAACFLIQLILLGIMWYRQKTLGICNAVGGCVCITAIFLLLAYVGALRYLDTVHGVITRYVQMSAIVLAVAGITAMVSRKWGESES